MTYYTALLTMKPFKLMWLVMFRWFIILMTFMSNGIYMPAYDSPLQGRRRNYITFIETPPSCSTYYIAFVHIRDIEIIGTVFRVVSEPVDQELVVIKGSLAVISFVVHTGVI